MTPLVTCNITAKWQVCHYQWWWRKGDNVKGMRRHCSANPSACSLPGMPWCDGDHPHQMGSFEVFKRSPQPLKARIVATAVFRRFLEFNMYSQRCISAGSVAARSACDLFRPAASPYLSPCTLAKPKESNNSLNCFPPHGLGTCCFAPPNPMHLLPPPLTAIHAADETTVHSRGHC